MIDFEVERGESQLWVDKYKPANVKSIIGQQGDKSNMSKLILWLKSWDKSHGPGATGKPPPRPPPWGAHNDNGLWAKAALLSGPPGLATNSILFSLVCVNQLLICPEGKSMNPLQAED